jgi:hypothetical protein
VTVSRFCVDLRPWHDELHVLKDIDRAVIDDEAQDPRRAQEMGPAAAAVCWAVMGASGNACAAALVRGAPASGASRAGAQVAREPSQTRSNTESFGA